ncbi:hypothetical protein OYE22_28875 [Streptomyces sp. 71268]|uniref:hypothetical protein n=1 Tax=Streptomyces sp. 71268 TaxID=3002640 RepID=UPI0023F7BFD4|nr:hypothetical protein [Streptomyces sp. 71268]WEV28749.1 hypothetical protein OYE22_28875 [Streptomyces sp. 71268]
MVIVAILLPPGLLVLVLVLGRYEEWLLGAPARPPRHARGRRHLSLVPRARAEPTPTAEPTRAAERAPKPARRPADAA